METVMIDCAEKFTRMADLAAAADEYRYNGLIDPTFQLNMARCTITPDWSTCANQGIFMENCNGNVNLI